MQWEEHRSRSSCLAFFSVGLPGKFGLYHWMSCNQFLAHHLFRKRRSCESYFFVWICTGSHYEEQSSLVRNSFEMKQLKQELSFFCSVVRASVGFPRKLVLKHQIFHKQSACKPSIPLSSEINYDRPVHLYCSNQNSRFVTTKLILCHCLN